MGQVSIPNQAVSYILLDNVSMGFAHRAKITAIVRWCFFRVPPNLKRDFMSKPKKNKYIYYVHATKTLIRFQADNYTDATEYMEENNIDKLDGELWMVCGTENKS